METLEGNKVKVYVEVDETEFETDIDQAFRTIASDVKMPGFRQGKVPRRVLEARIGVAAAREQALRDAIPNYLSKAVRDNEVDIIATPEVEITGGEEDGVVEFEAEVETRPVIEVPGYADLKIELDRIEPSDDEIANAQQAELKQHGVPTDVDRPAEAGDMLTLDLTATRDGEEVIGLNNEDWSYELGQGWVTDNFDDEVTGASVGDVIEFTGAPKGTEEPADFKVTVKAIQAIELPELTDEWVADNTAEFETVDEWTASLVEEIAEGRLNQVRGQVGPKVAERLAGLVDVELPESMVQNEVQQQIQGLAQQLQQNGIDLEQWLQMTGQEPQQLLEGARPQAEEAVKADLALRAVATAEGVAVTDHDLEQEYARMAMMYQQKAVDIRKIYEENDAVADLKSQIRKQKAMDWMVHNIAMVDEDGNELDRDAIIGHTHESHDDTDTDGADTTGVSDMVIEVPNADSESVYDDDAGASDDAADPEENS